MKKGAIIHEGMEFVCYLPENWVEQITNLKFIKIKTVEEKEIHWNIDHITNIREVDDKEFDAWVARKELQRQAMQRQQEQAQREALLNLKTNQQ